MNYRMKTPLRAPLAILGLAVLAGVAILVLRTAPEAPRPARAAPPIPSETSPAAAALPEAPEPRPSPAPPSPARSRRRAAFERLLDALRGGDLAKARAALDDLRREIVPSPVPEAENAAVLYRAAFGKMSDGPTDEETDALGLLSEGKAITTGQRALLKALVDRNREALDLLRGAADRPRCDFGVDYARGVAAEVTHFNGMIRASKMLHAEALLGEDGAAPEATRAADRLAEAVADEPLLISQLVRAVCHGIGVEARLKAFEGDLPREALGGMLEILAPGKIREAYERCFYFEVCSGVQYVLDGGGPELPRRPEDPLTAQDLAYYAQTMGEFAALASRPYYEVRDEIESLHAGRVEGSPAYAEISRLLMPAAGRASARMAVVEATLGTGQLAAALRIYREEKGAYPASLEALRGILPSIPLDPFTGKPYLYRREGSGFVVYSVGQDGADGGGHPGQMGEEDLVFRSPR